MDDLKRYKLDTDPCFEPGDNVWVHLRGQVTPSRVVAANVRLSLQNGAPTATPMSYALTTPKPAGGEDDRIYLPEEVFADRHLAQAALVSAGAR